MCSDNNGTEAAGVWLEEVEQVTERNAEARPQRHRWRAVSRRASGLHVFIRSRLKCLSPQVLAAVQDERAGRPEEAAVCVREAALLLLLLPLLLAVVPPAAGSRIAAAARPPAEPHRARPPAAPRLVLHVFFASFHSGARYAAPCRASNLQHAVFAGSALRF